MSPRYFDIHSHLYFPEFDKDRDEVLARMKEKDVGTITIGTDLENSGWAIESCAWGENIYATVGFHPAGLDTTSEVSELKKLASHPKVVAIGECGLDYFRLEGDIEAKKTLQKKVFEEHIDLAVEVGKPLMIHCRQAYADTLDILEAKKKEHGDKLRAHFHFFTEPIETAERIMKLGFTVSFTGVITFVKEYADIVAYVPLGSMMAETDAPFASPAPYRGKRNEPVYVLEIIKQIALIKKLPEEEVEKALRANTKRVFGI